MTSKTEILSIYKQVLKSAKNFPSIKRNKIIEEIKYTFRANAKLTDKSKIDQQLDVAIKGISQLNMYNFPKDQSRWTVDLDKNPMPQPENYKSKKKSD